MEKYKKFLKFMSVLMLIGGVLVIIASIIGLAGGTLFFGAALDATPVGQEVEQEIAAVAAVGILGIIFGVVLLVEGLFTLITGCFGLRAAKGDVKAAGRAKVLAIITLVVNVIVNIWSFVMNGVTWQNVCSFLLALLIDVVFIYSAHQVQHNEQSEIAE